MSSKNIFHGNGSRRRFACRMEDRTRLQRRRSDPFGDPAWLSAADAEHTRPAVEANRTQQSCGLWRPSLARPSGCAREPALARPDTHAFPASPPFKKRLAHSSKGSVPLGTAGGWGGSSGRISYGSRVAVWRGSGGRWDGHRPSPFYLGQGHADPALVPRPTGGPRPDYATTAVEIDGRGRRPIKPSGYLGGPGPHLRSRCSPDCLGSS